jgi:glutamine synthetase
LTGKHETQSIDKFSWGISDRGSSIRVPLSTAKEWKGYIEDRRPASNGDPYKICKVISETLDYAEHLNHIKHNMEDKDITIPVLIDNMDSFEEKLREEYSKRD